MALSYGVAEIIRVPGTKQGLVMVIFIFKYVIYLFLERGEGREKERNINVWLPLASPTGDLACNPGMCPDWESN